MNTLEIIDQIEELLDGCRRIPFSANIVLNGDEIYDLIEELRNVMPEELKQSRWIVKERENMIEEARKQAGKIVMDAEEMKTIKVGDKIGNRHGNKGVISTIMPEKKMPKLEDGRHIDICINPLGIISRMNIGQLFELHLGMAVKELKKQALEMVEQKKFKAVRKYLIDFIKIIDKTEGSWYTEQFIAQLPDKIDKEFVEDFSAIQPPFESVKVEDLKSAMEYTGAQFKYNVYDPPSQKQITNPIAVGYMYFFRMTHIADDKLAARGIGSYAKRTMQPLGGRKNKGGQRCGEMETACFIGHDAMKNLHEMFTLKSDCFDTKNSYIKNLIDLKNIIDTDIADPIPESVRLLNSYLTAEERRIGLAMNYCAGFIRQQENQQLGIPLDLAKTFTPRLQDLCGFGTYHDLIGHIDKGSPAERLLGRKPGFSAVWEKS